MQRGKTKADHQHLVVKDLLQKIKSKGQIFRQRIKEKGVDYYDLTQEERRQVIIKVIEQVKASQEGEELFESIKKQLEQQADMVSTSGTVKQSYLIDCFREATAFPIAKNREAPGINLQSLHGLDIKKQLRRVIWSRIFNTDRFRMAFSKWDREVTPYKLQQQLKASLEKAGVRHSLALKVNQTDNALRIVEYFLKAQGKLPQRYHFYLALLIVELYSFTKVQKICELGAVCLGLVDLVQYYNEPIELRLAHLKKVLEIIDGDSYSFIQTHYLNATEGSKNTRDFLQSFQMFRLTAGSYFLPLETSQFIIDQLLIRKKCKLDMYTLFSLMVLIASDQLQPGLKNGQSLKQTFQRTRSFLKRQEFVQAYCVIYQNIPAWFSADDLVDHPNNRLLALMLSLSKEQLTQLEAQGDQDFLVDLNTPARIGHKI